MSEMTSGLVERDPVKEWRAANRSMIYIMLGLARTSYLNSSPGRRKVPQRILAKIRATRSARAPLPAPPAKDTIV